ncbi:MAG: hypothetical protein AAF958_02655 [Planctomycetota bacterium]
MSVDSRRHRSHCFILGAGAGWHAKQLLAAAGKLGMSLRFANYESLRMRIENQPLATVSADASTSPLASVSNSGATTRMDCTTHAVTRLAMNPGDSVLTRTMPPGNLEQTTFRLACLHQLVRAGTRVANPPAALEIVIDKNATLAMAAGLGIRVPETLSTTSRGEALEAFDSWGGDCVVKPLFGGEGKGVMRIQDRELARTVFATLQTLGSVIHLQRFVYPGGRDQRILIIGDHCYAVRRINANDFRTNRRFAQNGSTTTQAVEVDQGLEARSRSLCDAIGVSVAAVDWIDDRDGGVRLIEVNAIPGWRSAQAVIDDCLALRMLETTGQRVTT